MTAPTSPVDELTERLRHSIPDGRSGAARDLLTELEDGLYAAAEAYRSAGLDDQRAERRAVHDFTAGDPGMVEEIAGLCRRELAASSTFRSAVVVAAGFPLLLGCWSIFYARTGSAGQPTHGEIVGDAFTWVGLICAALAAITAVLVRRRARSAQRILRRLAIGYALATLGAIATIYLLAAVTHAPPTSDRTIVAARTLVQGISLGITVVMGWTAVTTLRRGRAVRPAAGAPAGGRNSAEGCRTPG